MNQKLSIARVGVLATAFAAAAMATGGCGGDDEKDPEKVAIEATGTGKQITFEAPSGVTAGAAEIEFTNSSDRANDAQLILIGGEYSEEEVIGALRQAVEGEAVPDWFKVAGGVGRTKPGETNTVTQELGVGTYYVVGQNEPQTPLPKIEVSEDGGAELDEPEAKVTAQEYSFAGEGLKSGQGEILLENDGAQWHHFLASQIAEGKTIDDVKAFLESQQGGGPPQGPPPLVEDVGFQSTVLEGGTSQVVDVNLEPGKYAFFCFVSDKQGGPPHVAKGMVSEVTVEE